MQTDFIELLQYLQLNYNFVIIIDCFHIWKYNEFKEGTEMVNKAKRISAFFISVLLVLTAFTACGKETEETETQPDVTAQQQTVIENDAPVFMLEKLPEIGEYVDDLVYKRRYLGFKDKLIPADDYGKLIPFVGRYKDFTPVEEYYEDDMERVYNAKKYGLMTTEGEIVVDAVYDYYNILETDGRYFIELSLMTDWEESTSFLCPQDGSWVIEDIANVSQPSENRIVVSRGPYYDWESEKITKPAYLKAYDFDGNLIFSKENVCSYDSYSDGYLLVNYYSDPLSDKNEDRMIDLNGNYVFEDVQMHSGFSKSVAIASNGSLYGLITTDGEWLVSPAWEDVNRVSDERYVCVLGNWGRVYDSSGEALYAFDANGIELYSIDCINETVLYYTRYYGYEDYHEYYYLESGDQIICKETGDPVTDYFYGKDLFICEKDSSSILTDAEGNMILEVPATGYFENVSDNVFAVDYYDRETQDHTDRVFSFETGELIYTKTTQKIDGYYYIHYFWGSIGVTDIRLYDEVDDIYGTSTYQLFDLETGEVLRELNDYECVDIEGETYLCYYDGTYVYVEAPDSTIILKTANEYND